MSGNKSRNIVQPKGGFFQDVAMRLRLILRLLADRRVNPFLKLIPIGTIAYLVIPDLVLGPLDDALIIWLGTVLFVELCPPEVVEEHMAALQRTITAEWKDAPKESEGDVVDGEFREE